MRGGLQGVDIHRRGQPDIRGAVAEVRLFERRWFREFLISPRQYLSDPMTWPLALYYDRAMVQVEVDELKLVSASGPESTGTVSFTLIFSDSTDGIAWSTIEETDPFSSIGTKRVEVTAPFAAFLRVELVVSSAGAPAGTVGLVRAAVRMSLRRRETRAPALRPSPPLPQRPTPQRTTDGSCGCGS